MSETMENHFRQSLLLNQLIESTVDNLPLNRLAIGRTENQIEVYELVTEKVFQFFDVSLCRGSGAAGEGQSSPHR